MEYEGVITRYHKYLWQAYNTTVSLTMLIVHLFSIGLVLSNDVFGPRLEVTGVELRRPTPIEQYCLIYRTRLKAYEWLAEDISSTLSLQAHPILIRNSLTPPKYIQGYRPHQASHDKMQVVSAAVMIGTRADTTSYSSTMPIEFLLHRPAKLGQSTWVPR